MHAFTQRATKTFSFSLHFLTEGCYIQHLRHWSKCRTVLWWRKTSWCQLVVNHNKPGLIYISCGNLDPDFSVPVFPSVSSGAFQLLTATFSFCLRRLPVCEFVSHSVCQSAITLSRLFWLSRVGWGQGSEKLIPHNPSLPGQVAVLFRCTYTLT